MNNLQQVETDSEWLHPDAPITPLTFDPVRLAFRSDGWTPERQRAFIEELADCGIVREAAARVGMLEQSARRLRRCPGAAAFTAAWEAAVQAGAERLHSVALERAIHGTVRHRYFHGEVVGEERVYDNRLLIYLLGRMEARAGKWDVRKCADNWPLWLDAVEDRVEEPPLEPDASDKSPVWRDEDGHWLTSFPPPDDFGGQQWCIGEDDYCRTLTGPEQEAMLHWERREGEEQRRRRDLYFRRIAEVSHPR